MLSRSVSNGAICLGCQLRLLRQTYRPIRPLQSPPALSRRQSSRWFTNGLAARSAEQKDPQPAILGDETRPEHTEESEDLPLEQTTVFENPPAEQPISRDSSLADAAMTEDVPEDKPLLIRRVNMRGPSMENTNAFGSGKKQSGGYNTRYVNLGTRHVAGNRIQYETAQELDIGMLGKPGAAIIMRDGGTISKTKRKALKEIEDFPVEEIDLEAILDSTREILTDAEIRAEIDRVRPVSESVLSKSEFTRICEELSESFLKSQLSNYIEHYGRDIVPDEEPNDHYVVAEASPPLVNLFEDFEEPQENTKAQGPLAWAEKIESWAPLDENGEALQGVDRHLQGYLTPSTPAKEKLAVRVMRECWDISIAELSSGIGETRVKIRNKEFTLLMRGNTRFLRQLYQMHLESGERIEAWRPQRTLRIYTTRVKSQTIIHTLDRMLRNVKTSTFPEILVSDRPISEELLEEVGKQTNTYVQKSHTGRRIHVTWVEMRDRANKPRLEDLRHTVFRFLLTALGHNRIERTLLVPPELKDNKLQVATDFSNKEKLTWKDRMNEWSRVVTPLSPESAQQDSHALTQLELPLTATPANAAQSSEEGEVIQWSTNLTTSTTALFGHLLHSDRKPILNYISARESKNAEHLAKSIFSPVTPHPMHLATLASDSPDASEAGVDPNLQLAATHSELLVRLVPSPHPKAPPAPPLELRIAATDTSILGVSSLCAVESTRITDVMLPRACADFRLVQTRHAALLGEPEHIAAWDSIADFIEAANLDLDAGKLEMPALQSFLVPRSLFSAESASDGLEQDKDHDLARVQYSFAGLELHRSVSVPYRGFKLTYTSIEAGKMGGRRAQLSLQPERMESRIASTSEADAPPLDPKALEKEYLDACYSLAQTTKLWSGIAPDEEIE